MILEIARFWSSIATYNQVWTATKFSASWGPTNTMKPTRNRQTRTEQQRLHQYHGRVGIDGSPEGPEILPEDRKNEICETLALQKKELERWRDISRKMRVVFHDDGIISQFEGYDKLEEFDWEGTEEKRRHSAAGQDPRSGRGLPNRYKASKQADVLMLFYSFHRKNSAEFLSGSATPLSTRPSQEH
jgi:alpha,alpha-trehalase